MEIFLSGFDVGIAVMMAFLSSLSLASEKVNSLAVHGATAMLSIGDTVEGSGM